MTPPLPALRDFSDRLSPMVVKEMRQGLRTRFFTAALILFHVVLGCLMLSFLGALNQDEYTHEMFWLVIIFTLLGVLPSRAFNALNTEVKDGTLDMLMLTGITSFRIVWGKWVSLYSQTLLVASSLLPYMIVRYQFGGVEIAREVLALAVVVVGSGLVTAALIGFSSQRLMFVRLLMSATVGAGAFLIGVFAYVLSCEDSTGEEFIQSLFAHGPSFATLIIFWVLLLGVYLAYVFLSIGCARLPNMIDSQQVLKRKIGFGMMVLLSLVSWWISLVKPYVITAHDAQEAIIIAAFFPSLLFDLLLGMDLFTEELPVARGHLRKHILARPGWSSGVLAGLCLWLFPLINHGAMCFATGREDLGGWYATSAFMAAGLMPVCLRVGGGFPHFSLLSRWWLLQAVILILGGLLMISAETVARDHRTIFGFISLMTPATGLFGSSYATYPDRDMVYTLGLFINAFWILYAIFLALREELKSDNRVSHA